MKWYLETGPEGDVVISTRVRLARNLKDFPFPCKITAEQSGKVIEAVRDALFAGGVAVSRDFNFIEMGKLTPARAMSLAEKHIISPEFAQNREGRALLLNNDDSVSIMVNEEDHLRIQTLFSGLCLSEALKLAGRLDDLLDERLKFAFDKNLGYLTQCPTNLGTGLRASVMLHLPAITQSGAIPNLSATVSKLGYTIRGTYGEGSSAHGAFFQISNQVTLGVSEEETIENLLGIAKQIIAQERADRENLKKIGSRFEDKIWRSYGVLATARMLSGEEFMSLISDVRLGVTMGMLDSPDIETISALICEAQPATLMSTAGRNLDANARDEFRAQIVRSKIAKKT